MQFTIHVLEQTPAVGSGPPGPVRLQVVVRPPAPGGAQRYQVVLEAGPGDVLHLRPVDHRSATFGTAVVANEALVETTDLLTAITAEQWTRLSAQAEHCDHWEYRSIDGLAWRDSLPPEMALLQPLLARLCRHAGRRDVMAHVASGGGVPTAE